MRNLYLEIVDTGQMHFSARQSIISLLEKAGKDPLYLSSWRPLSLLNVDNKIYGKILANRMQKTLSEIIHPSQTGFVKGRLLAENIHKILSVLENCQNKKVDGFLVSFDFYKAFDTLEYQAAYLALEKIRIW